jgi:hypothetical protein
MPQKNITDIVATIVGELTPLESEDRRRVIQASLMLLGESPVTSPERKTVDYENESRADVDLPPRARTWMRQNSLSTEQLHQIFHPGDDGMEIIVSAIPGKGKRERVRNAYILLGTARLISSGDAKFEDKDARAICERYGFFDGTNHVKYMKDGNEFTGSKERGWTLTAPGLKHAASIISELTKS